MVNVLLLKSFTDDDESSDEYVRSLTQNFNVKLRAIPVLKFVFEEPDIFVSDIKHPEKFDGIILTSPRSVESVHRAFESGIYDETVLKTWRQEKICYVVGEASYKKILTDLRWNPSNVLGRESGNAKNLSSKIIADYSDTESAVFLYPCGNLKRDILPEKLGSAGIQLDIVECYQTEQANDLEENFEKIRSEISTVDFAIFFSPSGVKFSWPLFTKYFPGFEKISTFISIGPVTSAILESHDCHRIYTADKPDVGSLCDAFRKALEARRADEN